MKEMNTATLYILQEAQPHIAVLPTTPHDDES